MAFFINQKLARNQMIPILVDIPLVKVTVWRILQYLVIKRIHMSKLGCLSNSDRNNISIKGVNLMKKTYHLVNTVVFSDCTVIESDGGTN